MITFTITKDSDFLRAVATGETFPVKEGLKRLGFRWTNGAWAAVKLIDDDSSVGAWLEGIIRAYPGECWDAPEWLAGLVLEVRADQLGHDPLEDEPELPLFGFEEVPMPTR